MKRFLPVAVAWAVFAVTAAGAEPAPEKDKPVDLPPVVVESSQAKDKVTVGPRWKEDLLAPGLIWKLDHAQGSRSFLFDEDHLVRAVFNSKAALSDEGGVAIRFEPMRLHWRLENEWLIFFDQNDRTIEELRFVRDGWIWLSAARRSGEILKFRVTKPPPPRPIKIKNAKP